MAFDQTYFVPEADSKSTPVLFVPSATYEHHGRPAGCGPEDCEDAGYLYRLPKHTWLGKAGHMARCHGF